MPLSPRGSRFMRALVTVLAPFACGAIVFAQRPAAPAQKPDPAAQAQELAEQQEIQSLLRIADAAMTGQPPPADFPIQFQNDFLKALGSRVWVPITLTIDPAKLSSTALTLYLRVVPRGMNAPPALPAPADNKDKKDDKNKKDAKPSAAPAPRYPFEDVSFMNLKPTPGQPLRIMRGIGVPAGSYDLYVVLHERPAAAAPAAPPAAPGALAGKTSVLKQPLDVPNYATGEFSTSSVILAERVDQLQAPITPDKQSEHPYAFGQTEIVLSHDRKFKKTQELIV